MGFQSHRFIFRPNFYTRVSRFGWNTPYTELYQREERQALSSNTTVQALDDLSRLSTAGVSVRAVRLVYERKQHESFSSSHEHR